MLSACLWGNRTVFLPAMHMFRMQSELHSETKLSHFSCYDRHDYWAFKRRNFSRNAAGIRNAQSLDHIQRCHPGIKDCTMRLFQIATDKKNLRNNVLSFYVPFQAWKTIHRFINKYKWYANFPSEYCCMGPMRSPRPLPRFYDGSGAAANLISPTSNYRRIW